MKDWNYFKSTFFGAIHQKLIQEKATNFFILENFALYKILFPIRLTNLARGILYRRRAFHTIQNLTW